MKTMTNLKDLEIAIERGLRFLHEQQLPSGEFRSYRSPDPSMASNCELDSSPFPTAMISYSISCHDSIKVREMVGKASEFFLDHMDSGAVWRY